MKSTNTATEWTTVTTTSTLRSYTNYEPRELPTTDQIERRAPPVPDYPVPFHVVGYPYYQLSTACSCFLSSLTTTEPPVPSVTSILAPRVRRTSSTLTYSIQRAGKVI